VVIEQMKQAVVKHTFLLYSFKSLFQQAE